MKCVHIVFWCVVLNSTLLCAQWPEVEWSRVFTGPRDEIHGCGLETADGGILMAGGYYNESNWRSQLLLVKLDSSGDTLWTRLYGDTSRHIEPHCIALTFSEDFLLAGSILGQSFLMKISAEGDSLWTVYWDYPEGVLINKMLFQTSEQNIFLLGNIYLNHEDGTQFTRMFALKFDRDGNLLRETLIGSFRDNGLARGGTGTSADGLLICGSAYHDDGVAGYRPQLILLDSLGDIVWNRADSALGGYTSICPSAQGGYILTGGGNLIRKIDEDGRTVWTQYGNFVGNNLAEKVNGELFTTGSDTTAHGNMAVSLFTPEGNEMWTGNFGGPQTDACLSGFPLHDGGYALIGYRRLGQDGDLQVYKLTEEQLGIPSHSSGISPASFSLTSHPNPFNPTTSIKLTAPQTARTTLKIFDITGRAVETLHEGILSAGAHNFTFNAANLPTGIYFVNVQSGTYTATKKLLLLK